MIEIVAKADARVEQPFYKTADDAEHQLIQTAHKAANAGNWVIGECASRWFHGYARGRTDAAFAEMIEQGEDKVFQCRKVWEKFGAIYAGFKHLTWSHFRASLQWEDSGEFLEWAEDCEATVKEMIAYRASQQGKLQQHLEIPPVKTPASRVLPSEKQNTQGVRRDRSTPEESGKPETAPVAGVKHSGIDWGKGESISVTQVVQPEPSRTVDLALNQIGELLHFAFEHGSDDDRDALLEIIRPIWLQLAPPSLLPAKVPQIQAGLAIANTIVNEWNMIDGVMPCRSVTPSRRQMIATRMRDPFWKEHWREAIDKIRTLPALHGQNDQNWRANLDWFLRPTTVVSLIEGKYKNWKPTATSHDKRKSSNDSAFDEVFG